MFSSQEISSICTNSKAIDQANIPQYESRMMQEILPVVQSETKLGQVTR